ncbi:MAG: efflux RND transporter periplasmic adaptor subunit [Pseudomonadota bacterium]
MATDDNEINQTLGLGEHRKGRRGRWWWLLLPLLLVVGYFFSPFSGDGKTKLRYQSAQVERGDITLGVTATGTLEPLSQVEVGSELSGTIATVEVDFNDRVEEGQVLVRLDTTALQNRIAEGRAALAQAQARVQEARATEKEMQVKLARCQELAKKKMCSDNDVDAAEASRARAVASVASARAQVAMAEATLEGHMTNLKKAAIRSPIDGIVLDRKVEPGQTVAASLQTPVLFTLAEDLTQMELIVAVDEADIGNIRDGLAAEFTVDAYPERQFSAHINQVRRAPQTREGVVTYETVLTVDNSEALLLPGMTATAEIVVREIEDALLIPNAALRFAPPVMDEGAGGGVMSFMPRPPSPEKRERPADGGGRQKSVWVLREGQPEQLAITVGDSDGIHTEVVDGPLEPGMQVITDILEAESK